MCAWLTTVSIICANSAGILLPNAEGMPLSHFLLHAEQPENTRPQSGLLNTDEPKSRRQTDLIFPKENGHDASTAIQRDHAATTLNLAGGLGIMGIATGEDPAITTAVTASERLIVKVNEIDVRNASELSMSPDDIRRLLTEREVMELIAHPRHPLQATTPATAENAKVFFNGKDLTGWEGEKDVWSVDGGEIVGKSDKGLKQNQFLTSVLEVSDFKLNLKVKLTPDSENSGIQFRSVRIEGTEMRGPQADIGKGWWGKLYEESARGLLVKEGGEKFVKPDDWNDYTIEAKGSNVKIWINDNLVCDYTDEKLAKKGLIGLQLHSGNKPAEVRFKDLKLEVLK